MPRRNYRRRPKRDQTRPPTTANRMASDRLYRQCLRRERLDRGTRGLRIKRLVPGQLVEALVAYADGSGGSKRRPVVVVEVRRSEVVALPCTTQLRRQTSLVELRDWETAGLARPTGVLTRPVVLSGPMLLRVRGECSARDWSHLKAEAFRLPQSRDE